MKILFLSFVFTLFSIVSYGQMIPNNEFNDWTSFGSYSDPDGWKTPNPFLSIIGESTVFKSTDAYSGNYSVMMETRYLAGFADAPGLITLADIFIDIANLEYSIEGGLPLNENVKQLTGMYKYQGVDNDSATVLIYNFKRDNQGEIDTIGYGLKYLHNTSDWTPFTVEMGYINSHVPDTFNVIFLSSGQEFHTGSVLQIDSVAIETNTGTFHIGENITIVNVFPNPTTDLITFETKETNKNRNLSIFDINGKLISTNNFVNKSIEVSVINLPIGNYTWQVAIKNNISASGIFIKN